MSRYSFFASVFNGLMGGLLGAGGAACVGSRTLPAREAIMLNRAMGLVVVLAAWMLRATVIPLDDLAMHLDVVVTLLAGSLGGAWCAVAKARKNTWRFLDRVVMAILPALAFVMLAQAMLGDRETARLFASATSSAAAGVLAGFCIGFATTMVGIAGSLLLVPAIVVLFGIDIKIAGGLALMVALPTMLVGLRQFSGAVLVPFIRQEQRLCVAIGCSSLIGSALGVVLLHAMTPRWTLTAMLLVVAHAACTRFSAFAREHCRAQR